MSRRKRSGDPLDEIIDHEIDEAWPRLVFGRGDVARIVPSDEDVNVFELAHGGTGELHFLEDHLDGGGCCDCYVRYQMGGRHERVVYMVCRQVHIDAKKEFLRIKGWAEAAEEKWTFVELAFRIPNAERHMERLAREPGWSRAKITKTQERILIFGKPTTADITVESPS